MTIAIDKLLAVKTVVTHENCSDGLASAMIIKSVLPSASVVFLSYGSAAHKDLAASPGMLFCDFSPRPERVQEFVDAGAIVLDHHKYQKDVVEAFGENGVFADETNDPGVAGSLLAFREVWLPIVKNNPQGFLGMGCRAMYDSYVEKITVLHSELSSNLLAEGKSKVELGALIQADPTMAEATKTLEDFLTTCGDVKAVEDFATMISARDTWTKTSPWWQKAREANEALQFSSKEEWLTAPIFPQTSNDSQWNMRMSIGRALLANHDRKIAKTIAGAYKGTTTNGLKVMIHQGVSQTSDVAEAGGQGCDIILGFSYFSEADADLANWPGSLDALGPKIAVSCRSKTSFDVGAFAKANGGGGHSKAAGFGFNVKPGDLNPYVYLLGLVQAYNP